MTRSAHPDSSLHLVPPSLDPETGIRPIARWGVECARGWVCDPRFLGASGARVIKRKSRKKRPANSYSGGGGAL